MENETTREWIFTDPTDDGDDERSEARTGLGVLGGWHEHVAFS